MEKRFTKLLSGLGRELGFGSLGSVGIYSRFLTLLSSLMEPQTQTLNPKTLNPMEPFTKMDVELFIHA